MTRNRLKLEEPASKKIRGSEPQVQSCVYQQPVSRYANSAFQPVFPGKAQRQRTRELPQFSNKVCMYQQYSQNLSSSHSVQQRQNAAYQYATPSQPAPITPHSSRNVQQIGTQTYPIAPVPRNRPTLRNNANMTAQLQRQSKQPFVFVKPAQLQNSVNPPRVRLSVQSWPSIVQSL